MNIKNIPSPECFKANTTIRDLPFHSNKRRYTTLFHCPTKDVNFWMHSEVNWILITFSEKIRNCEFDSCPAQLEFIELYEAINDGCFKPDVPAFGKLSPLKIRGALASFKYQCEDFFVMQESKRIGEVFCTQYEDWSPKRLPKCEPNITCDVEPVDELKISYNWLWNEMDAVVGTIATFECIDNFTKINGSAKRECRSNGEWSEELPQCLPITTTTVETTTSPTLGYDTTTDRPYFVTQSNNIIYPTNPGPFVPPPDRYPNPYPTQNINPYPTHYPTPYPTHYPTPYPTHYPTPYPPAIYNPSTGPPVKEQTLQNSLNGTHFVYIILGILLGILITIGVIYYIQKKRRDSYGNDRRSGRSNGRPVRDEVYFDHMNNINNFNESRISNTCLADQTVDSSQSYPYDSAGYIQIEAVEALRMDSFKKYENYDTNARRQHKPLPEVPQ